MRREPDLLDTTLEHQYRGIRERIATEGLRATVLVVEPEAMGIATGTKGRPEATLRLAVGPALTARRYFRHFPPKPSELEAAIASVEDKLAPAREVFAVPSSLFSSARIVRRIASVAGVSPTVSAVLSADAVERAFDRLATLSSGGTPTGLPRSGLFAAGLLILREFMHHLQFDAIQFIQT